MNGITDYQASLIASGAIIGLVVGLLLWALVREHGKMRRWRDRAFEARREAIEHANGKARAIADASAYLAQRDALTAGRTTLRSVEQSDIEQWRGGQVSWS